MSNKLLSICIPTYNRADYLRSGLEDLILQVNKYGITICISDNASTDNTAQVVMALKDIYPNIKYSCNQKNMGADYNHAQALKMSETKYAWLLSDDDRIMHGSIGGIIEKLESSDYDLVIVNGGRKQGERVIGRVKEPKQSKLYNDPSLLLKELGWHLTWMSCNIFNRRLIAGADFAKRYHSEFMQFSAIFDWLAGKNIKVLWNTAPCIYGIGRGLPSWFERAFKVFAEGWYNIVMSLPENYNREAKLVCIKSHGVKSKCFSLKWLLGYRFFGYFNYQIYKRYKLYFPFVTDVPTAVVFLIAIIPFPQSFSRWLIKNSEGIKTIIKQSW